MPYIKAWDEESKNILMRLTKDGRADTPNGNLARRFGVKCKKIIWDDYLDIATTRYNRKKNKTIFVLPPNVTIEIRKDNFHFNKKTF